jgi:hypothetical protein
LFVADTNHLAGEKLIKIYLNDVSMSVIPHDTTNAFLAAFNGLKTLFGSDGFDTLLGDAADIQLYLLPTTPCVAGDIPQATLRLFIDDNGKPVDPATAAATLGTPAILFSGDASVFAANGFAVAAGSLTNASTSPSD